MDVAAIKNLLQSTEIFSGLPPEVLHELATHVTKLHANNEETIIHKDEEGDAMFIIASGTVRIHDGEHVVATMSKGNFFGEFSLLDAAPRSM